MGAVLHLSSSLGSTAGSQLILSAQIHQFRLSVLGLALAALAGGLETLGAPQGCHLGWCGAEQLLGQELGCGIWEFACRTASPGRL